MSTLYPNPLASPASQPQPNIMNQNAAAGEPMMIEPQNAGPIRIRPPRGAPGQPNAPRGTTPIVPTMTPAASPVGAAAQAMPAVQMNPTPTPSLNSIGSVTGVEGGGGAPTPAALSVQAQNAANSLNGGGGGGIRPPTIGGRAYSTDAPNAAMFATQAQGSYGGATTPTGGTNARSVRVGGIRPPRAVRPMTMT